MLRAIIGTDLNLKTTNPAVGATFPDWWTLNNHYGPALGNNISRACVDQDGWISAMTNSIDTVVPFVMNGYVPANPNKVTFGFRIKTLAAYGGAHSIIHLSAPNVPNDLGCYLFLAGSQAAPWLSGVGTEYFAEFTYDFVAATVAGRITTTDGTVTNLATYTPPALNAGIKAQWLAGNGCFNFRLATSVGGRYAIRDIYVLDDVAGDGNVAPLGVQRTYPVIPDLATGTDWALSAGTGTLLDTLLALPPATTTINSPLNKNPLNLSMKTTAPVGSRITGIQLAVTGMSLGDSPSSQKVEVTQNGVTAPAKIASLAKGVLSVGTIGVMTRAPDGTAWDINKLDATAIKLTPDTIG